MWEKGIRMFQFRVLTRFGLSNDERSRGYGTYRLIPLEALSARTLIIHMRAVSQIELMPQCDSACWAAHPLASVKNDAQFIGVCRRSPLVDMCKRRHQSSSPIFT
jgi:hypothetical protein